MLEIKILIILLNKIVFFLFFISLHLPFLAFTSFHLAKFTRLNGLTEQSGLLTTRANVDRALTLPLRIQVACALLHPQYSPPVLKSTYQRHYPAGPLQLYEQNHLVYRDGVGRGHCVPICNIDEGTKAYANARWYVSGTRDRREGSHFVRGHKEKKGRGRENRDIPSLVHTGNLTCYSLLRTCMTLSREMLSLGCGLESFINLPRQSRIHVSQQLLGMLPRLSREDRENGEVVQGTWKASAFEEPEPSESYLTMISGMINERSLKAHIRATVRALCAWKLIPEMRDRPHAARKRAGLASGISGLGINVGDKR